MKAKRIFKLSLWVVFGLLVIMTFVFLYKKAQPQATIYSVETVTRVPSIQRSIILTGKIAPRNEVMIVPQLNGIIAEIMKKPGDLVKAGDIIARIKVVPEMGSVNQAESQVEIAKIALDEAEQKYKIATELHQQGIVAEEEYATTKANYLQAKERLESAKDAYNIVLTGMSQRNAQGSTTLVRSTVDGTILDIPVKEGNSVIQANSFNAGTTIATIADMTEMIFIGKVDEVDIARVATGLPVTVRIGAIEGSAFSGVVEYISPKTIQQQQGTQYELKAAITIDDYSRIRSDMSANAELITDQVSNVLAVPEGALQFEGDKVYVEVVTSDADPKHLQTERREIKTGISNGSLIEVKSGLKEGEKVKGTPVAA